MLGIACSILGVVLLVASLLVAETSDDFSFGWKKIFSTHRKRKFRVLASLLIAYSIISGIPQLGDRGIPLTASQPPPSVRTEHIEPAMMETELICPFGFPCDKAEVVLGNHPVDSFKPLFIAPDGSPLFSASLDPQGRLLFNGTVFSQNKEAICEIRDNKFHLLNRNYKLVRPTLNHVLVKGHGVQLDCIATAPCTITITGHFYDIKGVQFSATGQGLISVTNRSAIVGGRTSFRTSDD